MIETRRAFQVAFELGWIEAETLADGSDAWMSMAQDRNLTSHTYKGEVADLILSRIRERHYERLFGLSKSLGRIAQAEK